MFLFKKKSEMVAADDALPGRADPIPTARTHHVSGRSLSEVPDGMEEAIFGMGCFWGVERMFWKLPGVWITQAGYAGGYTPNPDLSGGLLGPDRSQRGGAGGVRPQGRLL